MLASRRYVRLVGLLLAAFERRPLSEVPEDQRPGWLAVLDRMRQALALVGEYVASGRVGAYLVYHCNGTLDSLAAWFHQKAGDVPRPFPF
jgi:hypothetical protein